MTTAQPRMDAAEQLAIERWFVARGVPQFIEGYGSEARLDARAAPYLAGWITLGTVLYWGVNPEWSRLANVAGIIGALAWVAIAFAAVRRLRGRPIGLRGFDLLEIVLLGLLPAIAAGVIDGSALETVIAFPNAMLGIGIVYLIVVFGVVEVAAWTLDRLGSQVAGIIGLLATTLPILLILVAFLLFAAEIWEAAHALRPVELFALLALLLGLAALLIITTFRSELARMPERPDPEAVRERVRGTPVEPILRAVGPPQRARALDWRERANLAALVVIHQLLQSAFVAVLMMLFLTVFGLIALPADVQERWIGEPVATVVRVSLLGEERRLSAELLTVSAMLSGIVGLYFTGLAITDRTNADGQFRRAIAEVRQLLAARAVYLAALEPSQAAVASSAVAGASD